MNGKILGKITRAEYGMVRDYPFLFGLQLHFKLSDGTFIGSSNKYTINISKECKWEESERKDAIVKTVEEINKILKDARVNYVSELVNKPVEVEIERNSFEGFRILTEVL